ncbi:Na-K-Atpase Interacting protein [Trinorchestia longiramus]|nr:Na-K-Atpase Interacting protein [Trinorchestia longiramus]
MLTSEPAPRPELPLWKYQWKCGRTIQLTLLGWFCALLVVSYPESAPELPKYRPGNCPITMGLLWQCCVDAWPLLSGSRSANDTRGMTCSARGMTSSARGMTSGARGMASGARGMTCGARGMTSGARSMTSGARGMSSDASCPAYDACGNEASTVLRQVFDFLGFMWLPIIANFFNSIFVIFGFFGAYQYKPKYIITYTVWLVAWSTYNAFVMCFYLNVGALDNSYDYLNFRTGSASWWEVNGPGCQPVYPVDLSDLDLSRPLRPERVDGCLLDYEHVETVQAALQCLLALLGAGVSIYLLVVLTEEDDTFDFIPGFDSSVMACRTAVQPTFVR